MPRLFAALEIPYDAAVSLSLLRTGLPGARWVDEVDYHITLGFFGDVEGHVADAIAECLDRVKCPPFTLKLKGLDVFTPKKPHALYASVEPSAELNHLQATIMRKLHHLDISFDKKAFTPHVTLARLQNTKLEDLVRYLVWRSDFASNPFNVKRFVLMSSRESIGGGPYVVEAHWSLR